MDNYFDAAKELIELNPETDLTRIAELKDKLLEIGTKTVYPIFITIEIIQDLHSRYSKVEQLLDVETRGDVRQKLFELAAFEIDKSLKRTDEDAIYYKAFTGYLKGLSSFEIAQNLQVAPNMVSEWVMRDRWTVIRKTLNDKINDYIREITVVETQNTLTVQDQLKPITQKLGQKALQHIQSDEVSPKDTVRMFLDSSKLLATMTGELVEKKEISVTSTAVYQRILEASDDDFSAMVIDVNDPVKLIE